MDDSVFNLILYKPRVPVVGEVSELAFEAQPPSPLAQNKCVENLIHFRVEERLVFGSPLTD